MNEKPVRVTISPANPNISMVAVEPKSIPVEVVAMLEPQTQAEEFKTDPLAIYILAKG